MHTCGAQNQRRTLWDYMEMVISLWSPGGMSKLTFRLWMFCVTFGSDTTTSTITHLMYHLACSQTMFTKLQKELDKLPELSDRHLMSVELLDAIIFETLRLHPATPAGVPRVTSSNGLTIDGTYIPPDTVVTVPLFTLFRGSLRSTRQSLAGTMLTILSLGIRWTFIQAAHWVYSRAMDHIPRTGKRSICLYSLSYWWALSQSPLPKLVLIAKY